MAMKVNILGQLQTIFICLCHIELQLKSLRILQGHSAHKEFTLNVNGTNIFFLCDCVLARDFVFVCIYKGYSYSSYNIYTKTIIYINLLPLL